MKRVVALLVASFAVTSCTAILGDNYQLADSNGGGGGGGGGALTCASACNGSGCRTSACCAVGCPALQTIADTSSCNGPLLGFLSCIDSLAGTCNQTHCEGEYTAFTQCLVGFCAGHQAACGSTEWNDNTRALDCLAKGGNPPPQGGKLGDPCTTPADCTGDGVTCTPVPQAGPNSSGQFQCSTSCAGPGSCGTSEVCLIGSCVKGCITNSDCIGSAGTACISPFTIGGHKVCGTP